MNDEANKINRAKINKALEGELKAIKPRLNLSLLLNIVQVLIFIIQCYIITSIFSQWFDGSAGKDTINSFSSFQLISAFAVAYAARAALDYVKSRILQKASIETRECLRSRVLESLEKLGPNRSAYGNDGALSSITLEQVDMLDGYIRNYYIQKKIAAITPFFIAVATAIFSPFAAILMMLTLPLVPVFMILAGKAAVNKSHAQFLAMSRLSGQFLDFLRGQATINRINANSEAQRIIDQSSEDYRKKTMSVLSIAFLSTAILELFATLSIALVALYLGLGLLGILPWAKGIVPVAYHDALFILLLVPEFYAPLKKLGADYHDKAKAEAAMETIIPILESKGVIEEGNCHQITEPPALELRNVSIVYGDTIRLAPQSKIIKSGQRIKIEGKSGAGKSSLLFAILGFSEYEGLITIDGRDLAEWSKVDLRGQIAYLSQKPSIIEGSILENLRLADQSSKLPQIEDALKKVGLYEFIMALPEGIETQLGERGRGLSGGQLQRLSIAQLLLRDAHLWLLDEPTAHLDQETANSIALLLGEISRGKTVLWVSHEDVSLSFDGIWQIQEGDRDGK